jgi:(p)ppGpp synthase/HD superfamily hydrolase
MFDTLTYAKQLEAAGFPPKQAEALAMALLAVVDENLATKQDIENLRAATAHDIEEFRAATKQDIENLRAATAHDIEEFRAATKRDIEELRAATKRDIEELRLAMKHDIELLRRDVKEAESRIIIRLGGLIVVAVGALAVLQKVL